MSNKVENEVKSAAQIADDRRKEEERKKREAAAEREQIKKQAEAIACYYLRIGGVWYKKCIHPLTKQHVLERITAESIKQDYEGKLGAAILAAAPKYINKVNIPEHINYTESIKSPSDDLYYNTYCQLAYKPEPGGDFPHIRKLVGHIFGEQEEMGYDYLQLLYIYPVKKLPALLLVSKENATGKSTFCNFLSALFGDNAWELTPETFRSKFAAPWLGKLLVFIEETMLDDKKDYEKVKSLVTALSIPAESKGKDWYPVSTFVKFVFCSNNEACPVLLDNQDTRFWVRKVPPLTDKNPNEDFLEECKKEIPFFLEWLLHRQLSTAGTDRLWFTPEETRTEAWQKIVAGSRDSFERSLVNLLLDIMKAYKLDELRYSKTELNKIFKEAPQPSDSDRRKSSDIEIKEVMNRWGLKASAKTRYHKIYKFDKNGEKMPLSIIESRSSNIYVITRSLLENMND